VRTPEEYRARAERSRQLAAGANDQHAAELLGEIAVEYDEMAEQAESLARQKRPKQRSR